ncbi:glycosyltransferase family 4 protein [Streptomyces sp. MP131-18]|uniref:glycosyltransferase family 4 protein n=1 Tax=Streptomyces sp. MP131-18 TaxID=1857892 RepID=UPI00097BC009|nr:glycosyltransferase family 4 protein [Streptomyces sp. MP131-18]ONK15326.1 GDP-mannose-dependent alpha-(1-6)-phosphatidylinositol monomannoside mannosyltransferase [Streptomyces sp. MP131-18]
MSSSTAPPHGRPPLHVVQLLGGGSVGTGAHVRSLSAGLVARGVRVTVGAAPPAERKYRFTAAGARFVPVPVRMTPAALGMFAALCADADLVHAHGMRAGLLGALALRRRGTPLVVTWHSRSTAPGLRARGRGLTESCVARAASVVLATTSDLVDRARSRGARDARLAPVALPSAPPADEGAAPCKLRAELGAVGRPLLVAEARLDRSQTAGVLLAAARGWRRLAPQPLLAVVGEGPERTALQRRIDRERLPVRLLGRGNDPAALLADADVALLIARWAGRAPLAEEALRRGVPLVATAVGGVTEVVGDAAVLVPYGDPQALGAAVGALLSDPDRRAALAAAGRARARSWPTEDTTVAQVLSVYDELAAAP